jgi:hypothetical protein
VAPPYPRWFWYPSRSKPPEWVPPFVNAVATCRSSIGSATVDHLTSDRVLAELRPGLEALGFLVEAGKGSRQKIHLPVLFKDEGEEAVAWEVDAIHNGLGIAVEIEAGRGAKGNAVYRDLIRAALLVDIRFLALGVMLDYRHKLRGKQTSVASYRDAKAILDAIYESGRLQFPFQGVLLFGY